MQLINGVHGHIKKNFYVCSLFTLTMTLYRSIAIMVIVQMETHSQRDPAIP
jgi:hypothetical protein